MGLLLSRAAPTPVQRQAEALGRPRPGPVGRALPEPSWQQPVGTPEEEVSQSEAALGPTCGQGVKCAPVSSPPPLPLFFLSLSHLWVVVWGAGRLGGLRAGPRPSQEGGPPQLSVRLAGGTAFPPPLSGCASRKKAPGLSLQPQPRSPSPSCTVEAEAQSGEVTSPSLVSQEDFGQHVSPGRSLMRSVTPRLETAPGTASFRGRG